MQGLAILAVTFFVLSIVAATYLLVALPALAFRQPTLPRGRDPMLLPAFHEQGVFKGKPTVLFLIGAEQHAFLLGILCFGWFAVLRVLNQTC